MIQLRAAIRKLLSVADRVDAVLAAAVHAALAAAMHAALTRDDDYATLGKLPCDWDDPARAALVDALVALFVEQERMHHVELAWALTEAANHCLNGSKRFDVYLALGAGDTYTVIRDLTRAVMREQVELAAEVVAALGTWWAAHQGGDDRHIAALVNQLMTHPEPEPPPRYIKPVTIHRKYRRPNRTR